MPLDEPKDIKDEEVVQSRVVAFPEHTDITDEKHTGGLRPKGPEIKRELTREDKELAAAGYEHLDEGKAKKGSQKAELAHVDIQEHQLPLVELEKSLETAFDSRDPGKSLGLTTQEAAKRLARDGRNVLTPPRKKSALRKVSCTCSTLPS